MCMYTYNPRQQAKEDMTVYKVICQKRFEDTWAGPYNFENNFPFNKPLKNKEEHNRITLKDGMKVIGKGYFHCFWSIDAARRLKNLVEYDLMFSRLRVKAVKCIIPKGTTYYSQGSEIATKNIIVTDEEVA